MSSNDKNKPLSLIMGFFPSQMKQFVTKSLAFSKVLFLKNWKKPAFVHTFLKTSLHVELHLRTTFITKIFYHRKDNDFLFLLRFLQISVMGLHQCPFSFKYICKTEVGKISTDFINTRKHAMLWVIYHGSP